MNSPKWSLVERDFLSAARHFRKADEIYNGDEHVDEYFRACAFMHAIQSGHTSLEAGFIRIFKALGEPLQHDVDNWHEAVVDQAFSDVSGRGTILPAEMFADVCETRKARNLAVRGYDSFDMGLARRTAGVAGRLSLALPGELQKFIRRIDPQPSLDQEQGY